MITNEELQIVYEWGMTTELPYRKAPTAVGYSNMDIYMAWLVGQHDGWKCVRESFIDDQRVIDILSKDEVLFATGAYFLPGTELGPHKDPPVYDQKYSRIQIPLVVDPDNCYMVWKGEKKYWESGKFERYDVMDHVHEGYNFSEDPMEFIFIDVIKE
tara:strand:- start:722 stop:1192 length:471 start_codon:yes stop_codon:yes gene_type:complete